MKILPCMILGLSVSFAATALPLPNPGFESGWMGWMHDRDPAMGEITIEAAHEGRLGLRVTDAREDGGSEILSGKIKISAGETYRLSYWARVIRGGGAGIYLRFFSADGKELRPSVDVVQVTGATWTLQQGTFTAPANAVSADLYIRSFLKSTVTVDIDDVSVEEIPMMKTPEATADFAGAKLLPENPRWVQDHPRLLVNRDSLPALRARARGPGEAGQVFSLLQARADRHLSNADPGYEGALSNLLAATPKTPGVLQIFEGFFSDSGRDAELLSMAYLVTGEKKYAEGAARIVLTIAEKYPELVYHGFFYSRSFYLRGASLTYDWCYDSLTVDQRRTIRAALVRWGRLFHNRAPRVSWETWAEDTLNQVWNWNAGISAAWGMACLALLDETDEPIRPWLFQATRQVENYFRFAIDPAGGAIEGPAYVGYGAAPTPYFIEALRQITGEDLWSTTRAWKMIEFFPHELLPGGERILNIADSGHRIDLLQPFMYAMHRQKDPRLSHWYLKQSGFSPGTTAPQNWVPMLLWKADPLALPADLTPDAQWPLSVFAPWRGVMMSRTGWKAKDVLFTIHAQQCTLIKHDQADKGHINLYAYGEDFLIDSGYGNDGNMDRSSGSQAHNIVLIDGKGQAGGAVQAYTSGYVRDHMGSAVGDLARVDLMDAYEWCYLSGYEKKRHQKMVSAGRHSFFARGPLPYVFVYDEIQQDDREHAYTLQWHTGGRNTFSAQGDGVRIRSALGASTFPTMAVQPWLTQTEGTALSTATASGGFDAPVTLAKAGRYQVWALTIATGFDPSKSDSIFLQIDGGKAGFAGGSDAAWFSWKTSSGSHEWTALNDNNGTLKVSTVSLDAGNHMYRLKTREEGVGVLALLVVPEGETRSLNELIGVPGNHALIAAKDFTLQAPCLLKPSQLPDSSAEAFIRLASSGKPVFKQDLFLTTKEGAHPRMTATVDGVSPQFLYAILPFPKTPGFEPEKAVLPLACPQGEALSVDLPGGLRDVGARWDGRGIRVEGFETDGHFLWFRRNGSKSLIGFGLTQGRKLTLNGQTLFAAVGEDVSAVYDGVKLEISAASLLELDLSGRLEGLAVNGIVIPIPPGNSLHLKIDTATRRAIERAYRTTLY